MKKVIALCLLISFQLIFAGQVIAKHKKPINTPKRVKSQNVSGVFDYYLLSLSWSPTYCLTHANDVAQCGGKGYGFVLHGLWPQFNKGYPQFCATNEKLDQGAREFGDTIFPSAKLITHEWEKHGVCSGNSAIEYFQMADQARTSVNIPDALASPAGTVMMTAPAIASAILGVNPSMPTDAIVIQCGGPELSEVRVCFNKTLGFQSCGSDVKSNCGASFIRIPASR